MTKVKTFFHDNARYLIAGAVIGLAAIVLTLLGNPENMGFCIACFLRDTAGSMKLHSAAAVQYIRPEIIGIVLGAFAISLFKKDFSVTGGSSPLTRFVLGVCVMIGALVFLGCPLRMVLRIGGGDLNAIIGLVGFTGGIAVGAFFLNKGFSLNRTYKLPKLEGYITPASSIVMLILAIIPASFLLFSESGPGSQHAPIWAALLIGLVVGAIGQRVRVCFVGGIRDSMMFKQFGMLYCLITVILTVLIGNLIITAIGNPDIAGGFKFSFEGQNIAHTDWLWNLLGLFVVGLGSVFLGGCPFRQLVLAGSGNTDSAITIIGMIAGAAIAHNFGLASSAAGATEAGMYAIGICLVILALVGVFNRKKVT